MQLKQMTFALKVVMKFQVTFQGFFFCNNRTQLCHGICHFISLENNSQWQSVLAALSGETSKFQSPSQNSPIHKECQIRSVNILTLTWDRLIKTVPMTQGRSPMCELQVRFLYTEALCINADRPQSIKGRLTWNIHISSEVSLEKFRQAMVCAQTFAM